MAIGTGLALLGSAAIGAGASILSGSKQSKAAKDASNITAADNAANRAFQEQIYNRNVGYLAPWMSQGQRANNAFMELLGLGAPAPAPATSAFAYTQPYGQPVAAGGSAFPMMSDGGFVNDFRASPTQPGNSYGGYTATNAMGARNLDVLRSQQQAQQQPGYAAAMTPGTVTAAVPSARSAFDTYRGSTGYDFRFNEGTRALQSAFSRNLESGASTKAAIRYGQGIASDEFARYMQLLGDQSRLGLSGASALAGVGQNYGNTVVAGNQAAASAAANARLYAGNSSAQMWQGLGSSFGNALGWFAK